MVSGIVDGFMIQMLGKDSICIVLREYLLNQMRHNHFIVKQVNFINHNPTSKTLNTIKRDEVLQPQEIGELGQNATTHDLCGHLRTLNALFPGRLLTSEGLLSRSDPSSTL